MADPLSIFSSILALLQATTNVIRFVSSVSGASESRQKVLYEVSSLGGILVILMNLAKRSQQSPVWSTTIKSLSAPKGPLEQCQSMMKLLASKLTRRKVGEALTWPFRNDEINDILKAIERQKTHFVLALQIDHLELSQTFDDILADLRDEVQEISNTVSQIRQDQERWIQDQYSRDLVTWLSPLNFWTKQNDVFVRRQEGTGTWLLKADMFKEWLKGTNRILWCPGMPGAGKTVLASVVINHLEREFKEKTVAVAYVYCTYTEQDQSATNLVASLLQQLIQRRSTISDNIIALYNHHYHKKTRPSLAEYSRSLQSEISHFSKVFIIVDALDECPEGTRKHFLTEVRRLLPNVRLLITSRYIRDIENEFKDAACLEIRASDEDIKSYLETRIEGQLPLARYTKVNHPLRNDILNTIVEKASGMFLLAQLHMDSLAREDNIRDIRRALQSLPEELDRTYDDVMRRIQSQDRRKVERAEQVLSWISYAERPITVKEIQSALAVELDDTDLSEEALPDEDLLVSTCAGLVTIDRESNVMRLVHYTAQQYFERIRIERFPTAQTQIVSTCLAYLSFDAFGAFGEFEDGYCPSDKDLETRLQKYPLLEYASQHWGKHVRGDPERNDIVKGLVMKFLEQKPKISSYLQVSYIPKYRYERYSQLFPKDVAGLEVASALGLKEITSMLLENGADVTAKDSEEGTALHWAAWYGHEPVVRLLLEKGADINARYNSGGTALHWAAEGGHDSVVRLLLENKADVTAKDRREGTPLHRAASNGHEVVVRLLLENGANVAMEASGKETALHRAAECGYEAVARLLLDSNADVNGKDSDGGTALHRAAWNGHEEVVQLLLDRGADVTVRYFHGETTEHTAAESENEVVVRLLLGKGADVAAKYFCGGTALHWAAWNGHEAVVLQLLNKGADFRVTDSTGGTALCWAAEKEHEAVVKLLRERGGEDMAYNPSETEVERQPTELHWAAWSGHEEVVRPLLESGADVTAKNENGRTALHWAAWSGHYGVVRLLLEKGADIASKDNSHWTALHWAAWNGHKEVVLLLLEKGADISAKDSDGKTARDRAAASGHKDLARLLDYWPDVAAEDSDGSRTYS